MIYRGVEIVQSYWPVNLGVEGLRWTINKGAGPPDEMAFDDLDEAKDWVDEHARR